MVRPSLDQIRNFSGLALTYRWEVQFTKFPSVGTFPASEDLNIRCETVSLPKLTMEKIEMMIRGIKAVYPGRGEPDRSFTASFVETDDMMINKIIDAWTSILYDQSTGATGRKADVTGIITVFLLDTDDVKKYSFTFLGVWLSDFDRGNPEAGGSNPFKPSLTFTYDKYETKAL